VPMEPWPVAGVPTVMPELRAVLEVPEGPGVGVGMLMAWPVMGLVWAEAVWRPKPAAMVANAAAQRIWKSFIERAVWFSVSSCAAGSTAKMKRRLAKQSHRANATRQNGLLIAGPYATHFHRFKENEFDRFP
jgi:hypothetical protein